MMHPFNPDRSKSIPIYNHAAVISIRQPNDPIPSIPNFLLYKEKERRDASLAREHLAGLEVLEEDVALLRLLTPVLDDDARAVDDLASVALTVEDTCNGY